MPQKRNPGLVMRAREAASDVVGLAQTVTIRAHNVTTGMTDYKEPAAELGFFPQAVRMIEAMNKVLDALTINPERVARGTRGRLDDVDGTGRDPADGQQGSLPRRSRLRLGHRDGRADQRVHARTTFPYAEGGRVLRGDHPASTSCPTRRCR